MEKCVIYFSGGTMRGVFSAGVATYLEESGVHKQISTIRAASAGAFAAAYLMSSQTRIGSSIYYEDLLGGFISVRGFWGGIVDRLANGYIRKTPRTPVRNAVCLDCLFDAATTRKRLAIERLSGHSVDFWVKVLEIPSGTIRYLNIRDHDPIALLRASVSLIPYVSDVVRIGNESYADAGIVDAIGYKELRRLHPHDKLIVVYNGDISPKMSNKVKSLVEAHFLGLEYGRAIKTLFSTAEDKTRKDIQMIRDDRRALLISPPKDCSISTSTRDSALLKLAYQAGIDAGPEIKNFLNTPA